MSFLKLSILTVCMALMPLKAWCAIAPNTVALWTLDNTLVDSSGNGNTLTNTGPVPFVTTPTPPFGTYCSGPTSATKYFTNAAVMTSMSGLSAYTFEAYVYNNGSAAEQLFMSAGGAGNGVTWAIPADGKFKLVFDDARVLQSAAGIIATGSWTYLAMVVNGTSVKGYAGAVTATPTLVIDSTDVSPGFPTTGTNFYPNAYSINPSFEPMNAAYLVYVRLSSVARTSLPTMDTTASVLSPYIKQGQFPFVSPRWW